MQLKTSLTTDEHRWTRIKHRARTRKVLHQMVGAAAQQSTCYFNAIRVNLCPSVV
jgi:hypothetical protein